MSASRIHVRQPQSTATWPRTHPTRSTYRRTRLTEVCPAARGHQFKIKIVSGSNVKTIHTSDWFRKIMAIEICGEQVFIFIYLFNYIKHSQNLTTSVHQIWLTSFYIFQERVHTHVHNYLIFISLIFVMIEKHLWGLKGFMKVSG